MSWEKQIEKGLSRMRYKQMKQLAKAFLHSHCKPPKLKDFKPKCKLILLSTLNACRGARAENTALQQLLPLWNIQTLWIVLIYLINKRTSRAQFPNNFKAPEALLLPSLVLWVHSILMVIFSSLTHLAIQEVNWQYIAQQRIIKFCDQKDASSVLKL